MRAATGSGRRLLLYRPRPMRILHTFDEETPARVFGDALYVGGHAAGHPIVLSNPQKLVLSPHVYGHGTQGYMSAANFPDNEDRSASQDSLSGDGKIAFLGE